MTSALEGGRLSATGAGRLGTHFKRVSRTRAHRRMPREKKSPLTPLGIDPGTLRLVAQCHNHYTTPGPP
jgi:hypothetical protein